MSGIIFTGDGQAADIDRRRGRVKVIALNSIDPIRLTRNSNGFASWWQPPKHRPPSWPSSPNTAGLPGMRAWFSRVWRDLCGGDRRGVSSEARPLSGVDSDPLSARLMERRSVLLDAIQRPILSPPASAGRHWFRWAGIAATILIAAAAVFSLQRARNEPVASVTEQLRPQAPVSTPMPTAGTQQVVRTRGSCRRRRPAKRAGVSGQCVEVERDQLLDELSEAANSDLRRTARARHGDCAATSVGRINTCGNGTRGAARSSSFTGSYPEPAATPARGRLRGSQCHRRS